MIPEVAEHAAYQRGWHEGRADLVVEIQRALPQALPPNPDPVAFITVLTQQYGLVLERLTTAGKTAVAYLAAHHD